VTHKRLPTSPVTAAALVSGTKPAKAPAQTFTASKCNFWSSQGHQASLQQQHLTEGCWLWIDVPASNFEQASKMVLMIISMLGTT